MPIKTASKTAKKSAVTITSVSDTTSEVLSLTPQSVAAQEKPVKKPAFKLPKTIGECADMLMLIKEQKSEIRKSVEALEEREALLREHIIQTLPKSNTTGVEGRIARVSVVTKDVPQVADWDELYAYIIKTKSNKELGFNLLGRSVSTTLIRQLWEAGKDVPGVAKFSVTTLSLKKV